jgi:hypothetical protein
MRSPSRKAVTNTKRKTKPKERKFIKKKNFIKKGQILIKALHPRCGTAVACWSFSGLLERASR